MNQKFHIIDQDTWERKIYFDYYFYKIKSKYTLNATIDITGLIRYKEKHRLKFFPSMLYLILRAVNGNKEFRMGFNANNELGYWEEVVPCYTLFHDESKTFTDIWSEYSEDFAVFYKTMLEDMEKYKNVTGVIKARPGQPANFCPVSSLPWLSYTGFAQDTYTETSFLFPLIKFGKYFDQGDKTQLPFSVFVHHAVADGYHTCKLINDIQEMAANPKAYLTLS